AAWRGSASPRAASPAAATSSGRDGRDPGQAAVALRVSAGTTASLSLGGLEFAVVSDEEVLPPEDAAYRAFWNPQPGPASPDAIRVSISVSDAPFATGRTIFESHAHWSIQAEGRARTFVDRDASGPVLAVRFEPGAPEVSVECTPAWRTNGSTPAMRCPVRYPVDQILSMYLLGTCGILLHAAGVVVNGQGVVLAGVSGAGKTTFSRLAAGRPGWEFLSDDRVIVRLPDGTNEARAHGTPWPGEGRIAANESAPLARLVFLSHADSNAVRMLPAREAAARLMAMASIPWYDAERVGDGLEACDRLLERVPAALLEFRPDAGAVEAVERLLQ